MKKINKTLIAARNSDLETRVQEARFFEEMENLGRTPESIIEKTKSQLGLEENQSVIADWEPKFKEINKIQKNFVDVNGLTDRLIQSGDVDEAEIKMLNSIEDRIGKKLLSIFDLDEEDLYETEEDDE